MKRLAWLACVAVVTCGDPIGPGTGVVLALTSPHQDDGAVALTVTGTGFVTVTSADPGFQVFARQETADTLLLLVFGDVGSGPLAILTLQDGGDIARFAGTVTQAARRDNGLRDGVGGYAVRFTRP